MAESERSEITVRITSVDGNMTQSFPRNTNAGEVHSAAYDTLVQDKTTVPRSATTLELNGKAVSDNTTLKDLLKQQKDDEDKHTKKEKDVDLTLALTWVSQGGAS